MIRCNLPEVQAVKIVFNALLSHPGAGCGTIAFPSVFGLTVFQALAGFSQS